MDSDEILGWIDCGNRTIVMIASILSVNAAIQI